MSDWMAALYRTCTQVLEGDPALIAQLRAAGFECYEAHWSFRLPAVHGWLAGRVATPDYPVFLQQLYAGELNSRLAQLGAQIAIADNRGKVSESLYRLQRLP